MDDREADHDAEGVRLPTTVDQEHDAEAAYREHREAVFAMLHVSFPRLPDHEEIYQQAWVDLLELQARGEAVAFPRALLKRIAWCRAADAWRKHAPEPVDPSTPVLVDAVDPAARPDEVAQERIDHDTLWTIVDSLDEREAAVIKLRFDCDMSTREVQELLGIRGKRLEKVMTTALARLAEQLGTVEGREGWEKKKLSVLMACEMGIASRRQQRWAQSLIERDASARGMLRELRRVLHDVAVLLPMPLVVEQEQARNGLDVVTGRVSDAFTGTKHVVREVALKDAQSGTLLEHAGAGVSSIGLGAGIKVVLACIAVGGGAAACVSSLGLLGDEPPKPTRTATVRPTRRVITVSAHSAQVVRHAAPQVKHKQPTAKPKPHRAKKHVAVSSPRSRPAPSPAPPASTEFGPGSIGSNAAPSTPSSAPSDGGGEFAP